MSKDAKRPYEQTLTLEGILRHLTPGTIKCVIEELSEAVEKDWFYDEFRPDRMVVAARDAAIAYMKTTWPHDIEGGDEQD